MLLPAVAEPSNAEAIRVQGRALSYRALRDAANGVANDLKDSERVAVWATPSLETCVGVIAALSRGALVIPLNPRSGVRELSHIVTDSAPDTVLVAPGVRAPEALAHIRQITIDPRRAGAASHPEPPAGAPAFCVYTSGTTGPPKGAVLSRRAVASNLDALAKAWEWTSRDRLVHGLPLFHVHGLIIGTIGALRLGASVEHTGRFLPDAIGAAFDGGATMLFAVPTMYHRLADEADVNPTLARALSKARLLVSGSAPLSIREHKRIGRLTGQSVAERYGLTETLMNTAVRASGNRRPGYVGPPLEGVELRLIDDQGKTIELSDDQTFGEVAVRGPSLFSGYLNRPDATAESLRGGWFFTGDLATRSPDGFIRLVGRRSTDLIKSGGYKIGAGEIEQALLEHSAVAEAAVTAEPDPDLGERIAAWIVARAGSNPSPAELSQHVASLLADHKRPRRVRFIESLPRNEMGKVQKRALPLPSGD